MADKIAVLRLGRLEQFGRPLDLFNAPANRFVAGFIGSPAMNFIRGKVQEGGVVTEAGDVLDLPDQGFDLGPGQSVDVGIRAAHFDLHPDGLSMLVDSVEQLGTESYLYGHLSDGTSITLHRLGQVTTGKGATIHIRHDPGRMHVFDAETGQTRARS